MLGKLSVLLVLCQIVAFAYGGVLPPTRTSEETCSEMYVNCTKDEECCNVMRCMDFGNGNQCLFGTDNPSIGKKAGNAIQPPIDLIKNLGCSLFAQTCGTLTNCCAPYVCVSDGTCQEPVDPFDMGGYGGYPGFPGK